MQISVIVPIYNVEKYLRRCIDSILSQTYVDFELLLIDDGSLDQCGKKCDEYAEKDSRIYVIHKGNGGLSSARNAGLDIAMGEYIVFIDSDDYIDNTLFQLGMEKAIQYTGALVSYSFFFENEANNKKKEFISSIPEIVSFETSKEKVLFIINELTDYRMPWNAWSMFYSRKIIEKNNLRFADNKEIFAEDLYFSLCYIPFVKKIISIKEPLYHYTERTDSIMSNDIKKFNTSRFEKLIESVYGFYKMNRPFFSIHKYFPLIYYKVINHAILKDEDLLSKEKSSKYKEIITREILNKKEFKKNMYISWRHRDCFYNSYTPHSFHSIRINDYLYIINKNYFLYWMRNKMINVRIFK